jgi:acetyltransferase EpsM
MRCEPVAVIGAGGHATVVVSTLLEAGYEVAGLFDDDLALNGQRVLGYEVLGKPEDTAARGLHYAIMGVGDNRARYQMVRRLPHLDCLTVIHPSAYVHGSSSLGHGTVVMMGCIIGPEATVGAHTIINTKVVVGHHCTLEDFVHIAGSSHLGGSTTVATGAFLGMGTIINPGKRVGAWATIGSGGVVVNDIPPHVTAVGVPARAIKIHNQPLGDL